ncbi:uncharacterized protein IL334_001494 [Kwoniella shivajii]|uniref:Uncharacterized protein n=1 Tax=Kwoniella shivajii TaxID=564305 RepID=A0ABZ1CT82_9TREE|nr:hypothetical protein IL334_001494 [Kwoniella shivajii]
MSLFPIVSPQTSSSSALGSQSPNKSRPHRSTRSAVNYSERMIDKSSISPVPSTPSRSLRSRRSISSSLSFPDRSPQKKPFTLGRRRASSPAYATNNKEAALGLILGDEASTEEDAATEPEAVAIEDGEDDAVDGVQTEDDLDQNGKAQEGERIEELEEMEEGEEEQVEQEEQGEQEGQEEQAEQGEARKPVVPAHEQPRHSSMPVDIPVSGRLTRRRTISPEKKSSEGLAKKSVIRLVFGKKRRADEDSEQIEREDTLEPYDITKGVSTPEEPKTESFLEDGGKEDSRKRMPRKKRKWLKKGEVDPDDPVAVARQKERHLMIDEAIKDLDIQEEMLLANSHPQLLSLWEELEHRRELQMKWLEERNKAAIGDLTIMRDHEIEVAVSDFKVKRDQVGDAIVQDNRHKMACLVTERTVLRRPPGSMPILRLGRGGGGWHVPVKDLLSSGEQELLPVTSGSNPSFRRDISRSVKPVGYLDAKADLEKIGFIRNRRRSHTHTRASVPPPAQQAHPESGRHISPPGHDGALPNSQPKQSQPPPPQRQRSPNPWAPAKLSARWFAPPNYRSSKSQHRHSEKTTPHTNDHRRDPPPTVYGGPMASVPPQTNKSSVERQPHRPSPATNSRPGQPKHYWPTSQPINSQHSHPPNSYSPFVSRPLSQA